MTLPILAELRDLEAKGHDVAKLIGAGNQLLRRQFLFAGDHGVAQAYDTITDPRYAGYFSALFDALGYDLHRNETEHWVGLLPDAEVVSLSTRRVDETVLMLLLSLVWQELVNEGEIRERAVVVTTSGAIFDRYIAIVGKERIKESRFREILDLLRRRGLVAFGERDPESGEFEIEIRSMVRLVVGEEALDRLRRFTREATASLEAAERRAAQAEADVEDDLSPTETSDADAAGDARV